MPGQEGSGAGDAPVEGLLSISDMNQSAQNSSLWCVTDGNKDRMKRLKKLKEGKPSKVSVTGNSSHGGKKLPSSTKHNKSVMRGTSSAIGRAMKSQEDCKVRYGDRNTKMSNQSGSGDNTRAQMDNVTLPDINGRPGVPDDPRGRNGFGLGRKENGNGSPTGAQSCGQGGHAHAQGAHVPEGNVLNSTHEQRSKGRPIGPHVGLYKGLYETSPDNLYNEDCNYQGFLRHQYSQNNIHTQKNLENGGEASGQQQKTLPANRIRDKEYFNLLASTSNIVYSDKSAKGSESNRAIRLPRLGSGYLVTRQSGTAKADGDDQGMRMRTDGTGNSHGVPDFAIEHRSDSPNTVIRKRHMRLLSKVAMLSNEQPNVFDMDTYGSGECDRSVGYPKQQSREDEEGEEDEAGEDRKDENFSCQSVMVRTSASYTKKTPDIPEIESKAVVTDASKSSSRASNRSRSGRPGRPPKPKSSQSKSSQVLGQEERVPDQPGKGLQPDFKEEKASKLKSPRPNRQVEMGDTVKGPDASRTNLKSDDDSKAARSSLERPGAESPNTVIRNRHLRLLSRVTMLSNQQPSVLDMDTYDDGRSSGSDYKNDSGSCNGSSSAQNSRVGDDDDEEGDGGEECNNGEYFPSDNLNLNLNNNYGVDTFATVDDNNIIDVSRDSGYCYDPDDESCNYGDDDDYKRDGRIEGSGECTVDEPLYTFYQNSNRNNNAQDEFSKDEKDEGDECNNVSMLMENSIAKDVDPTMANTNASHCEDMAEKMDPCLNHIQSQSIFSCQSFQHPLNACVPEPETDLCPTPSVSLEGEGCVNSWNDEEHPGDGNDIVHSGRSCQSNTSLCSMSPDFIKSGIYMSWSNYDFEPETHEPICSDSEMTWSTFNFEPENHRPTPRYSAELLDNVTQNSTSALKNDTMADSSLGKCYSVDGRELRSNLSVEKQTDHLRQIPASNASACVTDHPCSTPLHTVCDATEYDPLYSGLPREMIDQQVRSTHQEGDGDSDEPKERYAEYSRIRQRLNRALSKRNKINFCEKESPKTEGMEKTGATSGKEGENRHTDKNSNQTSGCHDRGEMSNDLLMTGASVTFSKKTKSEQKKQGDDPSLCMMAKGTPGDRLMGGEKSNRKHMSRTMRNGPARLTECGKDLRQSGLEDGLDSSALKIQSTTLYKPVKTGHLGGKGNGRCVTTKKLANVMETTDTHGEKTNAGFSLPLLDVSQTVKSNDTNTFPGFEGQRSGMIAIGKRPANRVSSKRPLGAYPQNHTIQCLLDVERANLPNFDEAFSPYSEENYIFFRSPDVEKQIKDASPCKSLDRCSFQHDQIKKTRLEESFSRSETTLERNSSLCEIGPLQARHSHIRLSNSNKQNLEIVFEKSQIKVFQNQENMKDEDGVREESGGNDLTNEGEKNQADCNPSIEEGGQHNMEDGDRQHMEEGGQQHMEDGVQQYMGDGGHHHMEDGVQHHMKEGGHHDVVEGGQKHMEECTQKHMEESGQHHMEEGRHQHMEEGRHQHMEDGGLHHMEDGGLHHMEDGGHHHVAKNSDESTQLPDDNDLKCDNTPSPKDDNAESNGISFGSTLKPLTNSNTQLDDDVEHANEQKCSTTLTDEKTTEMASPKVSKNQSYEEIIQAAIARARAAAIEMRYPHFPCPKVPTPPPKTRNKESTTLSKPRAKAVPSRNKRKARDGSRKRGTVRASSKSTKTGSNRKAGHLNANNSYGLANVHDSCGREGDTETKIFRYEKLPNIAPSSSLCDVDVDVGSDNGDCGDDGDGGDEDDDNENHQSDDENYNNCVGYVSEKARGIFHGNGVCDEARGYGSRCVVGNFNKNCYDEYQREEHHCFEDRGENDGLYKNDHFMEDTDGYWCQQDAVDENQHDQNDYVMFQNWKIQEEEEFGTDMSQNYGGITPALHTRDIQQQANEGDTSQKSGIQLDDNVNHLSQVSDVKQEIREHRLSQMGKFRLEEDGDGVSQMDEGLLEERKTGLLQMEEFKQERNDHDTLKINKDGNEIHNTSQIDGFNRHEKCVTVPKMGEIHQEKVVYAAPRINEIPAGDNVYGVSAVGEILEENVCGATQISKIQQGEEDVYDASQIGEVQQGEETVYGASQIGDIQQGNSDCYDNQDGGRNCYHSRNPKRYLGRYPCVHVECDKKGPCLLERSHLKQRIAEPFEGGSIPDETECIEGNGWSINNDDGGNTGGIHRLDKDDGEAKPRQCVFGELDDKCDKGYGEQMCLKPNRYDSSRYGEFGGNDLKQDGDAKIQHGSDRLVDERAEFVDDADCNTNFNGRPSNFCHRGITVDMSVTKNDVFTETSWDSWSGVKSLGNEDEMSEESICNDTNVLNHNSKSYNSRTSKIPRLIKRSSPADQMGTEGNGREVDASYEADEDNTNFSNLLGERAENYTTDTGGQGHSSVTVIVRDENGNIQDEQTFRSSEGGACVRREKSGHYPKCVGDKPSDRHVMIRQQMCEGKMVIHIDGIKSQATGHDTTWTTQHRHNLPSKIPKYKAGSKRQVNPCKHLPKKVKTASHNGRVPQESRKGSRGVESSRQDNTTKTKNSKTQSSTNYSGKGKKEVTTNSTQTESKTSTKRNNTDQDTLGNSKSKNESRSGMKGKQDRLSFKKSYLAKYQNANSISNKEKELSSNNKADQSSAPKVFRNPRVSRGAESVHQHSNDRAPRQTKPDVKPDCAQVSFPYTDEDYDSYHNLLSECELFSTSNMSTPLARTANRHNLLGDGQVDNGENENTYVMRDGGILDRGAHLGGQGHLCEKKVDHSIEVNFAQGRTDCVNDGAQSRCGYDIGDYKEDNSCYTDYESIQSTLNEVDNIPSLEEGEGRKGEGNGEEGLGEGDGIRGEGEIGGGDCRSEKSSSVPESDYLVLIHTKARSARERYASPREGMGDMSDPNNEHLRGEYFTTREQIQAFLDRENASQLAVTSQNSKFSPQKPGSNFKASPMPMTAGSPPRQNRNDCKSNPTPSSVDFPTRTTPFKNGNTFTPKSSQCSPQKKFKRDKKRNLYKGLELTREVNVTLNQSDAECCVKDEGLDNWENKDCSKDMTGEANAESLKSEGWSMKVNLSSDKQVYTSHDPETDYVRRHHNMEESLTPPHPQNGGTDSSYERFRARNRRKIQQNSNAQKGSLTLAAPGELPFVKCENSPGDDLPHDSGRFVDSVSGTKSFEMTGDFDTGDNTGSQDYHAGNESSDFEQELLFVEGSMKNQSGRKPNIQKDGDASRQKRKKRDKGKGSSRNKTTKLKSSSNENLPPLSNRQAGQPHRVLRKRHY